MRIALVLTFLAFVAGPVVGCGGAPDMTEVKPGPPVPGLNLSGKWYSTEFGDMRLVQDDRRVTGTYEDPRGPDHNGRIEARVEGDVLWVEWIKPGNPVAAVFPLRGRAWLRISDEGKKLTGEWGYENNHSNGGEWEAEKSQFQ
jgi:hypothetical protein